MSKIEHLVGLPFYQTRTMHLHKYSTLTHEASVTIEAGDILIGNVA